MTEQTIAPEAGAVDPEADKLYNLRSAEAYTGVTATAIRYWILTGKVPAEMKGGQWQIRKADLDAQNAKSKEFAGGVLRNKRGKLAKPVAKAGGGGAAPQGDDPGAAGAGEDPAGS